LEGEKEGEVNRAWESKKEGRSRAVVEVTQVGGFVLAVVANLVHPFLLFFFSFRPFL